MFKRPSSSPTRGLVFVLHGKMFKKKISGFFTSSGAQQHIMFAFLAQGLCDRSLGTHFAWIPASDIGGALLNFLRYKKKKTLPVMGTHTSAQNMRRPRIVKLIRPSSWILPGTSMASAWHEKGKFVARDPGGYFGHNLSTKKVAGDAKTFSPVGRPHGQNHECTPQSMPDPLWMAAPLSLTALPTF
jgi:hypothetical protein